MGVSPRTIDRWRRENDAPLPGRSLDTLSMESRAKIHEAIEAGGGMGYPTLAKLFPDLPRRALKDFLSRRHRILRRRRRRQLKRLEWLIVGAIWAIDFATPSCPIGNRTKLLIVRELGSGMILLAAAVDDETSTTVNGHLDRLVETHGAPLVLKSDNGPAFRSASYEACLDRHGVLPLRSPVRRPTYNGACERSVGLIKERTAALAIASGHGSSWTVGDLALARQEANEIVRDRGRQRGTTAIERWSWRSSIAPLDRVRLREARDTAMNLDRDGQRATDALSSDRRERLKRHALCVALEQLGYLKVGEGLSYCSQ